MNVTFPEEYAKELAGKDAVFKVKITELREGMPVEIDDDFAKKMGAESLSDLKAKLRENQEAETGQYSRMRVKRDLLDKLDELHEFDLPENMIEGEFESVWSQFEKQRKEHPEQLEQDDKDKSDEELREEYRDISVRRVRLALLLAEIAKVNEISVSSEEINGAIMREAQRHKGKEKEVFDYYKNNPEAMQSLQSPLLEDKVVDFIVELADVSDKEVTVEELMTMPEPSKPARKKKAKKSSPTIAPTEKKVPKEKKTVTAKKAGSKKSATKKSSASKKS